jgi:hypothetical protein
MSTIAFGDVITFDEAGPAPSFFMNTTPLRDQYLLSNGVSFRGPTSDGGGAILAGSSNFAIAPFSGPNFLAFNTDSLAVMANGGFPIGPETATFSSGQADVSIMAASGSLSSETITMTAYDAVSNVLATSQVVTQGWTKLEISLQNPQIQSITLAFDGGVAVFDNFSFSAQAVPEPTLPASLAGLGALLLLRRRSR